MARTSRTIEHAKLRAALNGQPWLTRKERRLKAMQAATAAERQPEAQRIADYIRRDDTARKRSVVRLAGSAYGVSHRKVAFRI